MTGGVSSTGREHNPVEGSEVGVIRVVRGEMKMWK